MSKAGFDVVRAGAAIAAAAGAYNQYRGSRNSSRTANMGGYQGGGTMSSRSYVRMGRKRRKTAKFVWRALQHNGDKIINRWQQTSRTYIGPGRVFIGLGSIDAQLDRLPIHFISLTNMSRVGDSNPAKGAVADSSMCRMYYNRVNGAFFYASDVPSQENSGGDAIVQSWQRELREVPNVLGWRNSFHNWTDVRINLYGCYTVPIHYKILVCTMPEQLDPLAFGQGAAISEGSECANMFKDWSRKLAYDSVGTNGTSTWRADVKVLKELNYTIQPLSYSDQAAELTLGPGASKAAHIKEVKFFLRHDRFRDYNWTRDATYANEFRDLNMPGWDDITQTPLLCDVEWGKRVFMFITASTAQRLGADPMFMTDPAWATTHGSYDCCIRNCFTISA